MINAWKTQFVSAAVKTFNWLHHHHRQQQLTSARNADCSIKAAAAVLQPGCLLKQLAHPIWKHTAGGGYMLCNREIPGNKIQSRKCDTCSRRGGERRAVKERKEKKGNKVHYGGPTVPLAPCCPARSRALMSLASLRWAPQQGLVAGPHSLLQEATTPNSSSTTLSLIDSSCVSLN